MEENYNIKRIGILREEGDDWERRVALVPIDCKLLIEKYNIEIFIQPSQIRCYSDKDYLNNKCKISENLENCSLIIGIQKISPNRLIKNKSYIFFASAKKAGLPFEILDFIIDNNIRLFDYEGIKHEQKSNDFQQIRNSKVISFSRIAGIAGTANIFKGISELLLSRKYSTPFLFSRLSHMYKDIVDLEESFSSIGNYIKMQLLPENISPFVVGVIGSGNGAQGSLEVLTKLPHKFIDLKDIFSMVFYNAPQKLDSHKHQNKVKKSTFARMLNNS